MPTFLKKITNSKFISRSKVILVGTMIAQGITFLTSFVITAYYNPEDLGMLGTLTALISIIAGSLCFRLDVAVIQANEDQAFEVFVKSTLLGGVACTLFCLLCFLLPWDFAQKVSLFFIPFVLWCWGYCFFFNSRQLPFKFNQLNMASWGGIARSVFTLIYQLAGGLLNPNFTTLLSGRISGDYVGGVVHLWKHKNQFHPSQIFSNWVQFLKKHSSFVFYTAPQHFTFALSNNILIFFLERGYGLAVAGFYALAQRLIMAPIEVVGTTLANITLQRFGELRTHPDRLRVFYIKVILLTSALCLTLGGVVYFSADIVIPLLGKKWLESAYAVKCLVPFFMSYLFNLPTTNFLRFVNKSQVHLVIEIIELTSKVAGLVFLQWNGYGEMIIFYGVASMAFSVFRTAIVFKYISPKGT